MSCTHDLHPVSTPGCCPDRVQQDVTSADVDELVRRTAEAAVAYINGDIRRYLTLIKHGDDYTLMPPCGGEGPEWLLVHRHADPLVHPVSMEQMSVLARGQD